MSDVTIRIANEADAASLCEIYAHYVLNTAVTFEYTPPNVHEFANRMKAIQQSYPFLVCETGGRIAGYAYAAPFNPRDAYLHSVEVTVYIDKDFRRRGLAKRLYEQLEAILFCMSVKNLYACIAHTDTADEYLSLDSEMFHVHMGFKICGTFRNCGFKFGRWYSMVWAEKQIASHEGNPAPFTTISQLATDS